MNQRVVAVRYWTGRSRIAVFTFEILGPGHDVVAVVAAGGADVQTSPSLHVGHTEVVGRHGTCDVIINRNIIIATIATTKR